MASADDWEARVARYADTLHRLYKSGEASLDSYIRNITGWIRAWFSAPVHMKRQSFACGRWKKMGTVVCVGGGIGVAPMHPIVQAHKRAGNKVIAIIGARFKDLVIFEDEIRAIADEMIIVQPMAVVT